MKKTIKYLVLTVAALPLLTSCGKEWLEPKPLSFFAPENAYINTAGLEAALVAAERNMRHEFSGDGAPILYQYMISDMGVSGKIDDKNSPWDLVVRMLPTNMVSEVKDRRGWYWSEGWKGIKYANTALDRRVIATFKDEAQENEVVGKCYFHRAYRYIHLILAHGDIPWLDHEIRTPEDNFTSVNRWDLLEQNYYDMEFAYKWVTDDNLYGEINKGACGILLMKYCLLTGRYDRAIEVGKEVVAAHPLIQQVTFNKNSVNVIQDLHCREAKNHPNNTEILHTVISTLSSMDYKSERFNSMRNAGPYWQAGQLKTKMGNTAANQSPVEVRGTKYDNDILYGRGIATLRPSNYYQRLIWTEKEKNDMRSPDYGRNPEDVDDIANCGWREMTDLYYNHSSQKGKDPQYLTHFVEADTRPNNADTLRMWFRWPHYILYVPDETVEKDWRGGYTPWYVYRSAEAYLLMAEAYYWKNDAGNGVKMLNETRKRAGADELTAAEFGIKAILDERARELYYGERRRDELVRISFIYASTGKTCEWNGLTYSWDEFSGPEGTGSGNPCFETGHNFYFDWVSSVNDFYYKVDEKTGETIIDIKNGKFYTHGYGTHRIAVHNVLWPIPDSAILDNTGNMNQNFGYPRPSAKPDNHEPLRLEIDKHGFN